jgi:hypothetical protein
MSLVSAQRAFDALEQELGGVRSRGAQGSRRRERRTRNRPRVSGSWRDQGKGECFTRTNAQGGKYVVCNDPPRGSRGQKGVDRGRSDRGDADIKGRDKTGAIDKARPVMKKYDDDGELEKDAQYFTPLKKEGDQVILIKWRGKKDPVEALGFDGYTGAGFDGYTPAEIEQIVSSGDTISIPVSDFNAQYRVSRAGDTDIGGSGDALKAGEYELGEGKKVRGERPIKRGVQARKISKKLKKQVEKTDEEVLRDLAFDLPRKNIDLFLKIRGFRNYADYIEGRESPLSLEQQAEKARNYYRVEAARKKRGQEPRWKEDRDVIAPEERARQGMSGVRQRTILNYERERRARRARAETGREFNRRQIAARRQQQARGVRVMFEETEKEREDILRLAKDFGYYSDPVRQGGAGVSDEEIRQYRQLLKEELQRDKDLGLMSRSQERVFDNL